VQIVIRAARIPVPKNVRCPTVELEPPKFASHHATPTIGRPNADRPKDRTVAAKLKGKWAFLRNNVAVHAEWLSHTGEGL